MTKRVLRTQLNGQPVEVCMGWDRPLQYHFMMIEVMGEGKLTYCNLDDSLAFRDGALGYFTRKAASFGITLPGALLSRLRLDQLLNLGNANSSFDAEGNETPGTRKAR